MDRRSLLKLSGTLFAGSILTQGYATTKTLETIAGLDLPTNVDNPLYLHFNENSLGLSPKAKKAIVDVLSNVNRYPESHINELLATIADTFKVEKQQITIGSGSSDIIRGLINMQGYLAAQAGKKIQLISPEPSFSLAAEHASAMGIKVVNVPLDKNFCMDIATMKNIADAFDGLSICYLCNPNNPTGTLTSTQTIADWITQADATKNFFMVDEAYAEYITDPAFVSGTSFIRENRNNVIVLRTFSKLFAMAGMRLGFSISTETTAKALSPFMAIENISSTTAVAGTASLLDKAYINESKAMNTHSLKITTELFDQIDIKYLESHGNFLFHQIKCEPELYTAEMKKEGIIVGRPFPPLTYWSRVTLGTTEEMNKFLSVIKKFKKKGWI
ncbi:histidinol-phosphate aminotransferase family protein [Myroides albus]|uniref:pyridoxal phosphate-dependent aminotransferase n=1 Tax=Myroides albus TaxID=2562892 RepID=UPI002158D798|nr:histidinol-phosphate transaminase [Myroides albus]UVD81201.1 histidinol-phosphate aminotransferase family protein [Myroides albus]